MIEYLGKIRPFENTLACLSGTQIGSNHEKTEGRKSCDTLPLTMFVYPRTPVFNHDWNPTRSNLFVIGFTTSERKSTNYLRYRQASLLRIQ